MSKREPKKRYWRREIYLIAGICVGITVMLLPVLVHNMMGLASPFFTSQTDFRIVASETIQSPIDAILELIWLALPGIFVILVLSWIASRRTRWSGYDEAVKWTRR
ncbi:MAG: hypothetical protein ACFFDU_09595 [Candidatus Thorarchaeota archaeon]